MDRNSEEYRQGQRDARREAAITTGAGIASAVAIPAAINAAATYIPQGIQYARLANDLNRTRRAAQAARGTGQMLMRNAGSSAARYTPNEIFRMLEASRLTPLPGSLQKGGIVKGQTEINSENIDSAPEQVMRIPKYGTIRLLKSRNFAGSEQPDSTFTFAPISKSAYYIPGGTYSRFTNFDGNVETRGYDIDSPNNFTYGETAHRQFNGIRSLWEANKDKRKIVIPKNTGTY